MRYAYPLLTAALIGFALACLIRAGLLAILMLRFVRDLTEFQWSGQYLEAYIIAACLSFTAARLCRRSVR